MRPGLLATGHVSHATPVPNTTDDLPTLRAELAAAHESLDQWVRAEADWLRQRELFQIMMDNVADMIALLDPQGNRTWCNPAYGHMMGCEPQEMNGIHALAEVHPEDKAKATEALDLTLKEASVQQAEYRVQRKDGAWLTLHTETIPILNHENHIESVLLLAMDRTENKKLSEDLALAQTQATAAGVVEAMARDFDQILTNTLGNLTVAKNLNGPHNAIAVRLNEMERSLQRARDLIEQIFSITPDQQAPKVRVPVEATVQEAVSAVVRGTLIRPEYLFPRNLPEIEIDHEAFLHAIRNIVTNSVEAMDKGVVRISAEVVAQSQLALRPDLPLKPGDYLCLHLQDQGHGISDKALPRVFEPYFTTRSGSQGLGLSTALSSIQRMGGTIVIDSTPGVGTAVAIYLPLTAAPGDAKAAFPTTKGAAQPAGTAPAPAKPVKRRILLMDDEQMILDIVSRMLSHIGYEVVTCRDGAQAIAAFAKSKSTGEPYDVVMMDLVIPNGVGGQDAVHTIKKIDPTARVIASSGHLDHPVMKDHASFGFNAVLEKPYKLEKLQQVITQVVGAASK